MKSSFSVIIPLYNKEREIEATIRSVLAQTLQPLEIVVVNDGSKDRSAEIVRSIDSPLIRLIDQPNAGECAARNRAIREARGEYVALIDADDQWEEGFLEEIDALIHEYPDCGLYCTSFQVVSNEGLFRAPCLEKRGVVEDFFGESAHRYIAIPSASAMPRRIFDEIGGFPEGMKIAGDLYMWIKLARRYRVCFSPRPLVRYLKEASNRSASIYTPEKTEHSFEKLYDPTAPLSEREFVARAALGKALILCAKGDTEAAQRAIATFSFTKTYRRTLRKVQFLNRLPVAWRQPLLNFYNRMAWLIAKKGL
ncbi:MAG: glycosyltransferase family 2 protein [Alistipes sp.]|nr:glycosyltransferase family 2 protein [Alistipes sp.]